MTTLALTAWPVVTLLLVLRLPFAQAILISLIGGYLLLPTQGGMNLPLLPALNKQTIPALTLLVLGFLVHRAHMVRAGLRSPEPTLDLPGWIPRSRVAIAGLGMILVSALLTALTNRDPLTYGDTTLPAMGPYDGFSVALTGFTILVPLILGRKFFAHADRHLLILRGLVIAGVCMSLPVLYEVRMSPQLNNIVYGYFPHSWQQHIRNDGWRPLVFMNHGLQLAIFFSTTVIASFGLFRVTDSKWRGLYLGTGIWLLVTLFLMNSFGALIICLLVLLVLFFSNTRLQMIFAALIAGFMLVYPVLRSVDAIPTDRAVSMAAQISEDRAASLKFRFINEEVLIERALERPLFGWGVFDRARVFTGYGRDTVILDGFWIVILGEAGLVGYLTLMGFLALPIIFLYRARDRYQIHPATVVLCLIMTAALIDLIPNGFLSPVTLLVAGALWGRWELGPDAQSAPAQAPNPGGGRQHVYSRTAQNAQDIGSSATKTPQAIREKSAFTRQRTRHERHTKPL